MVKETIQTVDAPENTSASAAEIDSMWNRVVGRRSFLKGTGIAGAAAFAPSLVTRAALAGHQSRLTDGDVAILRFLAAAEIIETDLWQQYNELGGVTGGNPSYTAALQNLDGDMPQYIADNTDDELSHWLFLNAYLKSKGAKPVDLGKFRTLPSTAATGAKQVGRLTNLKALNVDTSWYRRYRSGLNPDFGATFDQVVTIKNQPAIPLKDKETPPDTQQPVPPVTEAARRMQAIANTAGFHFALIEQGGSSLYADLSLRASSVETLRIIVSIGGVEVNHFAVWHDKVGNCVSQPLAGVKDPKSGLFFPDLNASHSEAVQTNLIFPEPTRFIHKGLPDCSVIRPSSTENAGAVAAVKGLTSHNLFAGQSDEFFSTIMAMAKAADAAKRSLS